VTLRSGSTFLLLYALANAGGVIAYSPLLTLLLPVKIAVLAGPARVEWLGLATLLGALTASVSNILSGWASDRIGTRRGWIAAGLVATLVSYAGLALASSPVALVAAVVLFQAAVNIMLAPLTAWAADVVPDDRKGVLGGLIGAGPPAGALAGVVATLPIWSGESIRLGVVCGLVALLVLPLLIAGATEDSPTAIRIAKYRVAARRDFALLWIARLLVQVAAAVLFGFLLYYFEALPDPPTQAWIARLIAGTLALGFPLAVLVGRVSDRLGPRRPFLAGAAVAMAAGLLLMASADARGLATAGYLLFGCGLSVFLPVEAAFAMQLLPSRARHGRDLGLLNLANTLPSVAAPLLAVGLVPSYGYPGLLLVLAFGLALAAVSVLRVSCDQQAS
jgi:MFS family permease